MKSHDSMMQEQLPAGGVAIPGGRDLHMEIMDTQTRMVWMSVEVVTQQDFDELELDDELDDDVAPSPSIASAGNNLAVAGALV